MELGPRLVVDLGAHHDAIVLAREFDDTSIERLVICFGVTDEDWQDASACPLWLVLHEPLRHCKVILIIHSDWADRKTVLVLAYLPSDRVPITVTMQADLGLNADH